MFKAILFTCLFSFMIKQIKGQCWAGSYPRGVGITPQFCDNDMENSAGLCYPNCKPGYRGGLTLFVGI